MIDGRSRGSYEDKRSDKELNPKTIRSIKEGNDCVEPDELVKYRHVVSHSIISNHF